jgi:hypothetical protein
MPIGLAIAIGTTALREQMYEAEGMATRLVALGALRAKSSSLSATTRLGTRELY